MTWVQFAAVMIGGIFGLGVVLLVLSLFVRVRQRQLLMRWLGRAFRASALVLAPACGGVVLLIETPNDLGVLAFIVRLAGAVVLVATLIAGLRIARAARRSFELEFQSQQTNRA